MNIDEIKKIFFFEGKTLELVNQTNKERKKKNDRKRSLASAYF